MRALPKKLPGELGKLARLARKQDWDIRLTAGGHLMWYPPDGGDPVISNSTPAGGRADANHRSRMIRAGLVIRRN
jgi:hypothetical protein